MNTSCSKEKNGLNSSLCLSTQGVKLSQFFSLFIQFSLPMFRQKYTRKRTISWICISCFLDSQGIYVYIGKPRCFNRTLNIGGKSYFLPDIGFILSSTVWCPKLYRITEITTLFFLEKRCYIRRCEYPFIFLPSVSVYCIAR